MPNVSFHRITQIRGRILFFSLCAAAAVSLPLAARQGPPTVNVAPPPASATAPKADSNISTKPPDIPVEQIIKKFGDRELEFKKERDNYTYTQTFVVQTIDYDG